MARSRAKNLMPFSGKHADIVIFDGNPNKDIDYSTFMAIIDGHAVYTMS